MLWRKKQQFQNKTKKWGKVILNRVTTFLPWLSLVASESSLWHQLNLYFPKTSFWGGLSFMSQYATRWNAKWIWQFCCPYSKRKNLNTLRPLFIFLLLTTWSSDVGSLVLSSCGSLHWSQVTSSCIVWIYHILFYVFIRWWTF